MLCEMFTMGDTELSACRDWAATFSQPQTPATLRALLSGIATVILIVVATDQLIWRPLIAWSDKFKFEQVESTDRVTSPILALLQRSPLLQYASRRRFGRAFEEPIYRRFARTRECRDRSAAR